MSNSSLPTAVDPVTAANMAGSAPMHMDLSMWGLFMQADWVVKLVMFVLLAASIWSWVIIVEKIITLKNAQAKAKQFEQEFWSSDALDKFHERVKKRASHPLAVIFTAAMEEWFRSKNAGNSLSAQVGIVRAGLRERISHIMQVATNRELESLERGIGFLATTGSTAPFIGLFGTVWGIMNSFHSIAATQNTSLAAVAPGIAEALFATAIGLFAAIPAYVAYNKISRDINRFAGKMEDFSLEFTTILSRQIDG
jgi:biopolymer transport protein TolQ